MLVYSLAASRQVFGSATVSIIPGDGEVQGAIETNRVMSLFLQEIERGGD